MLIVLGNHALLFFSLKNQLEHALMTILFHFGVIQSPFRRIMENLKKGRPDWNFLLSAGTFDSL
jgi:hypothetical protein